jgi:hypothetical protein
MNLTRTNGVAPNQVCSVLMKTITLNRLYVPFKTNVG